MKMATNAKEIEQVNPTQVTTKDPKKVAAGKKLAEYNRRKKEELKEQKKNERESENSAVNLTSTQCCYGIGAFAVAGAIIIIGYQVWKSKKKGVESFTHNPHNSTTQKPKNQPRKSKFEME